MPDGYSCTRAQYGSFEQGVNNISVYNSGINPDGSFGDTCGWAQPVTPETPTGELKVYFSTIPEGSAYWVLETDYERYASGYACTNHTLDNLGEDTKYVRMNSAWILTRERNPTQELVSTLMILLENLRWIVLLFLQIDQALEVFDRNGLSFDDWEELPQSDECVNDNSPSCKDTWPDNDS